MSFWMNWKNHSNIVRQFFCPYYLINFWMLYVDSIVTYPVDYVYSEDELDVIDRYKADFESSVSEQEGLSGGV